MLRKILGTVILLAVLLGVVPQGVQAQSAITDPIEKFVQFTYTRTKSLAGQRWTDEKGILHVRNRTDIGLIQGDLNGYAVVTFNSDIETKTGNGKEYGTITIYESTSKRPRQVQWAGDWTHEVVGGTVVGGEMQAKKLGLNEGMLLVVDQIYTSKSPSPTVLVHEGYIQFVP